MKHFSKVIFAKCRLRGKSDYKINSSIFYRCFLKMNLITRREGRLLFFKLENMKKHLLLHAQNKRQRK